MVSTPSALATNVRHQEFLTEIQHILSPEHLITAQDEIELRSRDTVPGRVLPMAYVYPGSTAQVSEIVRLADRCGVTVWPHSSGRNWGWSNSPLQEGAVVMILERMNRILEVNEDLAYAVIEPGVSYESLNNYLKEHGIKLWADCTAGPPKGSVLGNALDRGVGVTTHGEHFASLCGLEVVLSNGQVIRTGPYPNGKPGTRYMYKWGIGPYLEGLFSQANFGIVTQGGVWLMPEPEAHEMFGFTIHNEEHFVPLLNTLRKLALDGVIPDKIRVTNDFAVLTLLTQWIKETIEGRASLTDADMQRLDKKYHIGGWAFCSSLYGRKDQVAAQRKIITRELKSYGRLVFFDDRKVALVKTILPKVLSLHQRYNRSLDWLASHVFKLSVPMIQMVSPLYEVYKGIPTEQIVRRAYFRSPRERPEKEVDVARDAVGLIWFGPLVPLIGKDVFDYIDLNRKRFKDSGFDCYITVLMLNARTVVPLMGIIYRKEDAAETKKAAALYEELCEDARQRGFIQFRCGRLGWPFIYKDNPELLQLNTRIKEAFDPHHTIAPGKYGLP